MENLAVYVSAFTVCGLLIYAFRHQAVKVGLIDRPCDRKRHCGEVPLIGGLAIFSAFLVSLFLSNLEISHYYALLAGCAVLLVVGVYDDIKALSSGPRFLAQIIAGMKKHG